MPPEVVEEDDDDAMMMERDEDDDEDDEEDDDDDGYQLGSPALASSLESSECVHDLELSSPPRGSSAGRQPPSLALPKKSSSGGAGGGAGSSSSKSAAAGSKAEGETSGGTATRAAAAAAAAAKAAADNAPSEATAASSNGSGDKPTTIAGDDGRTHHLALLLNGQMLPFSMTIFQAIRQYGTHSYHSSAPAPAASAEDDGEGGSAAAAAPPPPPPPPIGHRLWGDVYSISYQPLTPADAARVTASEASTIAEDNATTASSTSASTTVAADGGLLSPPSSTPWQLSVLSHEKEPLLSRLASEPPVLTSQECGPASSLVRLLWLLIQLEGYCGSLYTNEEGGAMGQPSTVPNSLSPTFLNRKLNAKLLRQLADPLALCSRSLPSWCSSLAVACPSSSHSRRGGYTSIRPPLASRAHCSGSSRTHRMARPPRQTAHNRSARATSASAACRVRRCASRGAASWTLH